LSAALARQIAVGMVRRESTFEDRERLAVQVDGLVSTGLLGHYDSDVVQLTGRLRMVESQNRLSDGEAVSEEALGVGRIAAGDAACGEVAEVDRDFVLVGWVAATEDREGSLEECFCLVGSALVEKCCTEYGEILRDEVVIGPELSFVQSHCPGS
jgi:hypothetical protein